MADFTTPNGLTGTISQQGNTWEVLVNITDGAQLFSFNIDPTNHLDVIDVTYSKWDIAQEQAKVEKKQADLNALIDQNTIAQFRTDYENQIGISK